MGEVVGCMAHHTAGVRIMDTSYHLTDSRLAGSI